MGRLASLYWRHYTDGEGVHFITQFFLDNYIYNNDNNSYNDKNDSNNENENKYEKNCITVNKKVKDITKSNISKHTNTFSLSYCFEESIDLLCVDWQGP